jgi:hypothetical protein
MDPIFNPLVLGSPWDALEQFDFDAFLSSSFNTASVQQPGIQLELKTFEVRTNSKGDSITLETGRRVEFPEQEIRNSNSAFTVTKQYGNDNRLIKTTLVVRSAHILAALRAKVERYEGLDCHNPELLIEGSPKILFHYRKELQDYGRSLTDQEGRKHILFALNYMQDVFFWDIQHFTSAMASNNPYKGLDFDRLWMAYRPGDIIFDNMSRPRRAGKLIRMEYPPYRGASISLLLENITCGAEGMVYSTFTVSIQQYTGVRLFDSLSAYPLRFHPDAVQIRSELEKKMWKLKALCGVHQKFYKGCAHWASGSQEEIFDDDGQPRWRNCQVRV